MEVRLEDRLQHQLERGLDTGPDGRDPAALGAAGFGISAPAPATAQTSGPSGRLGARRGTPPRPHGRDVGGRLAIYPAERAPCCLDRRTNQQKRRITDEVVEVAEPTCLLVGCHRCSLVWIPSTAPRPVRRGPRCVGIHQRPPGMPAPRLRTRCRLRMPATAGACGRLSRPRTTTAAPSIPRPTADGGPAATGLDSRRGGRSQDGSHVHHQPVDGVGASYSPAASPRVRRRPSPWPPGRQPQPASESPSHAAGRACAAAAPIHQISSRFPSCGGSTTGSCNTYTFPSCLPGPGRLAVQTRPSLSGLLHPPLRLQG